MYQSIQVCRGISAMLVVLFHLGGNVALDRYFGAKAFDGPFSFGDAGVAFFFVLSGFIITLAHWDDFGKPAKLLPYLKKRAIRIYPSYWIVGGAVLLLAYQIPSIRENMPHGVIPVLSEALLLPQDAMTNGGTGATVLIVAWSLQYEVFFYLLTALLIVNPTVWAAAVISIGVAYVAVRSGLANPFPLSFFTSENVPLFGFGMIAAYYIKQTKTRSDSPILACTGIALFASLGAVEVLTSKLQHREILYGLAAAVALFGLVRLEKSSEISWNFPKWKLLGDSSYLLYLIHFPVISIVCKGVRSAGIMGTTGAALASALSIVGSVGGAIVLHKCVEIPILRSLRTKRASSYRAPAEHLLSTY